MMIEVAGARNNVAANNVIISTNDIPTIVTEPFPVDGKSAVAALTASSNNIRLSLDSILSNNQLQAHSKLLLDPSIVTKDCNKINDSIHRYTLLRKNNSEFTVPSSPVISKTLLTKDCNDKNSSALKNNSVSGTSKVNIPAIPKKPTPSTLSRHTSAPCLPSARRCIFGHLLEKSASSGDLGVAFNTDILSPPPPPTRRRSQSLNLQSTSDGKIFSINQNNNPDVAHIDIRQFAPPPLRKTLTKKHFRGVDEFDDDDVKLLSKSNTNNALPTLPTPLQRFCSGRKCTTLSCGVYPMIKPKSILRESSVGKLKVQEHLNENAAAMLTFGDLPQKGKICQPESVQSLCSSATTCTTASAHTDVSAISTNNSNSSASINSACYRKVQFDPRVTVTEFDDPAPRMWYSEYDLERFQQETVVLARSFLIANPDLITYYNKASLDPVTNTMRKKPLFSMPALGVNDYMSTDETVNGTSATDTKMNTQKYLDDVANNQVKNILIVDPNQLILNLFRKSFQALFPNANIMTLQSGEEALQLYCSRLESDAGFNSFDLILVEERLRSIGVSHTPLVPERKSYNRLDELNSQDNGSNSDAATVKYKLSLPSRSSQNSIANSGSHLFKAMALIEQDFAGVNNGNTGKTYKKAALKIGVSVKPDQDRDAFMASGADDVWGKPPPHIDIGLRDELVSKLLLKRQRSELASASTTSA